MKDSKSAAMKNFCGYFNLYQYNKILNCNNKILDLVLSNLIYRVVHKVKSSSHRCLSQWLDHKIHAQSININYES